LIDAVKRVAKAHLADNALELLTCAPMGAVAGDAAALSCDFRTFQVYPKDLRAGTGSAPFLAEMLFLQMADIKMTHVPYRGASPAFTDLIPGRVDCLFSSGASLSYSRSGQVRVLATSGPKRDVAAPDVPTIAEAGVPGYDVTAWQALFVPAKTPPEVVRKISADTNTALANPAIRDKLAETGYAAGGSSPEELGTLLKSEIVRWSALVKSVGITLD
jgi:tripartite-type tricarboxylate transporter receptor subunit TctC